jgi:hypothetical protein
MACCEKDAACCDKAPQCCVDGKECCAEVKACCAEKSAAKTAAKSPCCQLRTAVTAAAGVQQK